MQDENQALIPGPGNDERKRTMRAEQGCLTQVKKGIPIFLALLGISIAFVALAGGLIAHFTGFFDYQQAVDQYRKGNYKEALEYCTSAVDKNPRYAMAYLLRGTIYLTTENMDKAMPDLNRAIELNPGFAPAYDLRGVCSLRDNKPEGAIKDFNRALELNPDFAQSYFNRGVAFSRMADYEKALADLKTAEEKGFRETRLYAVRSEIYRDTGKTGDGNEEIEKALRADPNNAALYVQRGTNYGKAGEYEKAAKDFDKALDLGFKNDSLYRNRSAIFWREGKLDKAAEDVKSAMEYKPDEIYLGIWRYILETRRGKDAKDELKEVMKSFGKKDWPEPVALMLLGEISREQCLKEAKSKNARLENEQKCEAYFYIAEDCIIKGEKKEAAEYLRKCLNTGVKNFYEYDLAGAELKHLEESREPAK